MEEENRLEVDLHILDKFEERMLSKRKKRYIKIDLSGAYDPTQRQYLLKTERVEEYRHLLRCYNISEQSLKKCLWEINNPDKPYIKDEKWSSERTYG